MGWIVFEGSEGVGKSTQIEAVFQKLSEKYEGVCKTREPGGTPIAESIRTLFKTQFQPQDEFLKLTEFLLVSAARNEHIQKFIRVRAEKNLILCDRFLDSTYVYQNILGNVSKKTIDSVTADILQGIVPDLTFILTCRPETALERIQDRKNTTQDRYDNSDLSDHKLLLDAFEKIFHEQIPYPCGSIPKRFLISTDDKTVPEITAEIVHHICQELSLS